MFTPSLRTLRKEFPSVQIDVLVMYDGAKDVLGCSPDVDNLYQWNFMQQGFINSLRFCLKLRQNNYDVSFTGYPANRYEYNLISILIGARVRIGHRYNVKSACRSNRLAFHYHINESPENELHNVRENLKLLECVQINPEHHLTHRLRLYLSQQDLTFAEKFLTQHGDAKAVVRIGIHPGSGETKNLHLKRWPIGNFAKLADSLILSRNAQVFVFGGNNEKQLREKLQKSMTQKPIIVEGISLRQSAALIQHCDVLVSADTALMHVAAAVGTPTVSLYGPTNPSLTAPLGPLNRVVYKKLPCSPCYFYSKMHLSCYSQRNFECIASISPTDVINEIDLILRDKMYNIRTE